MSTFITAVDNNNMHEQTSVIFGEILSLLVLLYNS